MPLNPFRSSLINMSLEAGQKQLYGLNNCLYSLQDRIPTSWKKAAVSLGLAGIVTLTGIVLGCTSKPSVTPTQSPSPTQTIRPSPIITPTLEPTPAPTAAPTPTPSPSAIIPIIDVHAHCQPSVTPEVMLENMNKVNVTKVVLMPNQGYDYDGAKSIALKYPNNFIAFIGFQNKEWITQTPGFPDTVEKAITNKDGNLFKGFGEVLLRHYAIPDRDAPDIYIPATSKNSYRIFSLSEKYNMPVTIHMEAEEKTVREFETALKDFPKTKFIWAHAGRAESSLVERMLGAYSNLYIDISALDPSRSYGLEKNPITTKDGMISPDWKQLLINFQDRVMTGSDMPFKDLWATGWYTKIINSQRALLNQLPNSVIEKISYKNASIMLGGR